MGCATSAAADKYADSGRGETTSTDKVIIKTRRGREFINQYQLGDVLGRGAFGVVRHARCKTRLGGRAEAGAGSQRRFEDFAIKMLSKPRLKRNRVGLRKSALDLLAQEIAVWKKLDHPNVCNLIEVINDPHHDEVFLVSEFVRGGTLLQDKRNVEVLPESRCKHYFRQILKGLAYLHRNNVAHRDIKPANIMLTDRSDAGVVKLVDFGVADMWDGVDGADEKAGFVKNTVGTMEFFSPEMCKEGGASFDVKLCDVWAAGVTLHLMVAGRLPSIAQSMEELFHKIINDPLNFEDDTLSRYEPGVFDLLQGLLMKHPDMRWSAEKALTCKWLDGTGVGVGEPLLQDGTLSIRDSMSDSEVQNAMSPVALRAMVKFSSFRDRKPGTLGLSSAYAVKVDGQEEQEEY